MSKQHSDVTGEQASVVYLDGHFKPREQACISIDDRGFLFGDGIYEVIRVVEGRPFLGDAHLERMDHGLNTLNIRLPDAVRTRIPDILNELIRKNRIETGQATMYIQITRGPAQPRKHFHPVPEATPTVLISATAFEPNIKLQKNGAHAITVPDLRWMRCDLKTINLLPNTLAAQQAREQDAFGAIMVRDDVITEGSNNNVFAVMDGTLFTHPDSPLILSGITRNVVFEMAETSGIPIKKEPLREADLFLADEVILTGTTTDIQPVIRINGREIGDGRPGPVARLLQKGLRRRMGSS